jgi:hypothetical protein
VAEQLADGVEVPVLERVAHAEDLLLDLAVREEQVDLAGEGRVVSHATDPIPRDGTPSRARDTAPNLPP